ncbi:MAG TPA: preprotein translocase subunit SecY [Oscillospiraceae bacterium]|nr:preprotein translocase subunit SecY [Oscillospiraceae bacterium]HPS34254.1 preprotein translocase subunit SecY [Oscillospiraceae bacterium]
MFKTIRNAFAIPELRKKIFYTFLIIAIFRIGAVMVTVPFVDPAALTAAAGNQYLSYINLFTGGGFEKGTLFALSISPYITSSIIVQLLTVAIPSWERMQKEGEEGRKKLGQVTRAGTVIMALIEGFSYFMYLRNTAALSDAVIYKDGFQGIFSAVVIIASYIAGATLMMWLGEQINKKGIGNGVSLLLFAGIVANFDSIISSLTSAWKNYAPEKPIYYGIVPLLAVLLLVEIYFVVYMDAAERRLPVQYAKRVVGRKVYGGQNTNMPLKVNMANVLPVIFANSLLSLPTMLLGFGVGVTAYDSSGNPSAFTGFGNFLKWFSYQGAAYMILYIVLIVAFAYFYISITYNPVEMANNLRKNSGTIPGIRPGKPTSDYISRVLSRIILIGALALSIVVLVPMLTGSLTNINLALGGTTIIIVVGVAIETARTLESQMLMRHYKGFLE